MKALSAARPASDVAIENCPMDHADVEEKADDQVPRAHLESCPVPFASSKLCLSFHASGTPAASIPGTPSFCATSQVACSRYSSPVAFLRSEAE